MKKQIWLWQLVGFAVVSLFGTLLHFLYGWLGDSAWIAPFSGVNESTFEHMKLLFWPSFGFAAVQSLRFRDRRDFWCIKLRGILLGLVLIPVIFYTYNGVIGSSPDWINIAIFFISAAAAFLYETMLFERSALPCSHPTLPIIILLFIGALFIIFTFATPILPFFRDPLTGSYGI